MTMGCFTIGPVGCNTNGNGCFIVGPVGCSTNGNGVFYIPHGDNHRELLHAQLYGCICFKYSLHFDVMLWYHWRQQTFNSTCNLYCHSILQLTPQAVEAVTMHWYSFIWCGRCTVYWLESDASSHKLRSQSSTFFLYTNTSKSVRLL